MAEPALEAPNRKSETPSPPPTGPGRGAGKAGGVLAPDGSPADAGTVEEGFTTERAYERSWEEENFVPVIVKRTDQARRHPDDILAAAITEGMEQLERPSLSLALSAVAAGLIVGFSAMAVAVVTAAMPSGVSPMLERLATALVYPLGFVLCIMSGTELFTEHTATAVYPVLDRRSTPHRLLRLWGIVIAGNVVGAAISAALLFWVDPVVGAREAYVDIGHHLVAFDLLPLLGSALLAGWLMALGAWLILATPPSSSQIVSIYIVTFLIGLGGLHHSIAGSVEMFAALFHSPELALLDACRFIGLALAGNLVGGSLFVAVLNYGHIRRTQAQGEP